jgi:NADP-dependent 3-hydroxy acid dehydrogenase YdfG
LSISSLFDVKGKVALVTGGGSGIGEMIANALVQNGAKVYIASRKENQLKQVNVIFNPFLAPITTWLGFRFTQRLEARKL